MPDVVMTADLERDCPPFLEGWRGMRHGAPALLDLLRDASIPATLFTTARAAEAFPDVVRRAVREGHEIGCHGRDHRPFPEMSCREAEEELETSLGVLREFAPVTSFRAPYLALPEAFVELLELHGIEVDASRTRYKPAHWIRPPTRSGVRRLVTSMTSSVLRLPRRIRDPILLSLPSPVVLFVHPWEFVDLSGEELRWDCRLGTGEHALRSLREVVDLFRSRGARFLRVRDVPVGADPVATGPSR